MPFRYRQLLDISEAGRDVHCISFSSNGDYVVLGTDNRVTVWDIDASNRFEPDLKTADPLSIAWISKSSFVVGYRNGSIYTFTIVLAEQRLEVSGFVASQQPILHLSSNASGTELASAGLTQVGIWAKITSQGALHWRLKNVIPRGPPGIDNQQSRLISIAWFPPERQKELLVVYESHVIVWDTETLSARKKFNIPGPITSGALSSVGGMFVVATRDGSIQIWDVRKGIPIASNPQHSKLGAFVRFIHGGHGLLVGGHAHADILESVSMLRIQTMWLVEKRQIFSVQNISQLSRRVIGNSKGKQLLVNILGDYCNDTDSRYLIATASTHGSQAVIWKGDKSSSAIDGEEGKQKCSAQLLYTCIFFLLTVIIGFLLGTIAERKKIVVYFTG